MLSKKDKELVAAATEALYLKVINGEPGC